MTTTFDAVPMCGAATPPIRGRDQERALLRTLLARGESPVIDGPPGSGKSVLLHDLVVAARAVGYVVYERSGWVDPGIVRQMNTARSRQAGSVVIAWDDPPWTDAGFLPPTMAVVWALTRRAGDGRPSAFSTSKMVSVWLKPLAPDAIVELLTDRLGVTPRADLLALVTAAAGNPGAIADLVEGLREEGLLDIRAGAASLGAQRLPQRTQARVHRQLDLVSPLCRELVQLSSTLPQPFGLADVSHLMRRHVGTLLSVVQEALTSGLVVGAGERLAFSHQLVREAVAQTLPPPVRSALRHEVASLRQLPVRQAAPVNQAKPTGDRRANVGPSAGAAGRAADRAADRNGVATGWESLSEKERQIARLIATNGLTDKQIATRLERTTHTVNYHLRQIYLKLGINSRVQLASLTQAHLPHPNETHPHQHP